MLRDRFPICGVHPLGRLPTVLLIPQAGITTSPGTTRLMPRRMGGIGRPQLGSRGVCCLRRSRAPKMRESLHIIAPPLEPSLVWRSVALRVRIWSTGRAVRSRHSGGSRVEPMERLIRKRHEGTLEASAVAALNLWWRAGSCKLHVVPMGTKSDFVPIGACVWRIRGKMTSIPWRRSTRRHRKRWQMTHPFHDSPLRDRALGLESREKLRNRGRGRVGSPGVTDGASEGGREMALEVLHSQHPLREPWWGAPAQCRGLRRGGSFTPVSPRTVLRASWSLQGRGRGTGMRHVVMSRLSAWADALPLGVLSVGGKSRVWRESVERSRGPWREPGEMEWQELGLSVERGLPVQSLRIHGGPETVVDRARGRYGGRARVVLLHVLWKGIGLQGRAELRTGGLGIWCPTVP